MTANAIRWPAPLLTHDTDVAVGLLRRYFGHSPDGHRFTGSWFDEWDSDGDRADKADHFVADDLVAVSLLSVQVEGEAARLLLDSKRTTFACLLEELGPDRDLVDEVDPWADDWAGWRLWQELLGLPGVGPTIASKLLARKRPRLRPIYDTVVARTLGVENLWDAMREDLQRDPRLHEKAVRLREEAELPPTISALRVIDIVVWMIGKGYAPE